ncbi:MAG: dethiobiotin synthase [Candidatus Dadabacteria bacterium]|nr:MAG: dethiobiotin synthase [Candidatus Dadabacteria bacterium]
MTKFPKGIFVTGTDTGVGKTVVAAAIAWNLTQAGKRVALMKPVQTGTIVSGPTDIEFVQKVLGADYSLDVSCPYMFSDPVAPLVASMLVGERIDIKKIKDSYSRLSSDNDFVIVEGAGGLLVPILEDYFMSDLALDLDLPVLIVTRPNLGTLNHTFLTLESAKKRGLDVAGIVISNFPWDPGLPEQTNPELILSMTGDNILGVIPNDNSISVVNGDIGNIRDTASSVLSKELGGSFVLEEFLSSLE